MSIFITGTDTNVGKTIVSGWICSHLNWNYFKPIQTGTDNDSNFIESMADVLVHEPVFSFPQAIAPHAAARINNTTIDISKVQLPGQTEVSNKTPHEKCRDLSINRAYKASLQSKTTKDNLIVEGAGGVLVPLQKDGKKMIDLIQLLKIPVIVVARASLGTVNHTLLTLEALQSRKIKVLGIVLNAIDGYCLDYNADAIEEYGSVKILMNFPYLKDVTRNNLLRLQIPHPMKGILQSTQ